MATTGTYACTADARIYESNLGSGQSDYLPAGLWSSAIYRSLLKFSLPNWSALGIRRIVSAHIHIRNSSQFYVGRGASPRVLLMRLTENWSEGSSSVLSTSNAVRWDNQPAATATGQVDSGTISAVDNAWIDIDCTAIARAWAPTSVESGSGLANYGVRIRAFDETTTSRTTEFYSSEGAYPPQLVIVYETNTAPGAPTGLSPAADSDGGPTVAALLPPSKTTQFSTIVFGGTRADADAGDYITAVQVQVFADSATDAVPGSALVDSGGIVQSGAPTAFSIPVDASALTVGTSYRARARTADKNSAWGAWSSLLAMRFKPDTIPSAPANPSQDSSTQTPNFYGSLVDPDPSAAIAEVRILVYQDTSSGPILKWDSGFVSSGGTRFAIAYGGTTLDFGTKYRWAGQIKDNVGGIGPLGSYTEWTPNSTAGPSNMTPRDIETKQNTLTPVLTIGHASAFDAYELEVAKYDGGPADLWDVPITAHTSTSSKAVTYAGLALTWGRVHWWRAKVRVGGVTWTEWSPWFPFYVNAVPLAPAVSISGAVDSGIGIYGAYVTVVGTTPTIVCPFADPDLTKGYADVPIGKQIELRRADTDAVHGSYSPATIAGTAGTAVVSPALTTGVVYKVRVRWQDAASQYGPWSAWLFFKSSTTLTISAGTAPSSTDPTPTFAWTLGRSQVAFRVLVKVEATGELVHDSGVLSSTVTSYVMPPRILQSGVTYRYSVTAYDADALPAVLA